MFDRGFRSRRCTTCLTNWPLQYEACPVCLGEMRGSSEEPILHADAKSRASHAAFDRFYETREEARRKLAVEGLERDLGAITEAA